MSGSLAVKAIVERPISNRNRGEEQRLLVAHSADIQLDLGNFRRSLEDLLRELFGFEVVVISWVGDSGDGRG